jgi:hypothetical protein
LGDAIAKGKSLEIFIEEKIVKNEEMVRVR